MINKKLIRKWVKVLRSRKYKQGKGFLRQKGNTNKQVDRFCCLGVLCDIINNKGWDDLYYEGEKEILPEHIRIGIGLDMNIMNDLMYMNDDKEKKFYQIANYLEKKFLKHK